ncbi:hypothetical protein A3B18_00910 [Candidatus Giovannonibacteria bacterium RIFCSPLOWO2_01_FULL_46_13]|uniref:Uncharacterized protein n=1 Tax=Candidatus Giovannonibacteria bacterium RIFCSPLOWO2_01_FULL_46_13 TaxID=1798352 RepID=A0A1F5X3Q4_9BACT|nr:MAG: hypothetical protein A3B18_00910 [Candidatus Giovannonibacteria bacterium RIFCSPLOWO2_01_FULL_46_13]
MRLPESKYIIIAAVVLIATGGLYFYDKSAPEISIIPENVIGNPTPPPASPNEEKNDEEALNANITAQSILNCLGKAGESGNCLDLLFRAYLKTKTPVEALALATKLGNENSTILLSCHPVVHAIGRETFLQKKTVHDSFAACDQTCHSGCYHGAMERFLRGELASEDQNAHISEEEVKEKTKSACDLNQPLRFRFQCLHGLGHALMFFLDYDLEGSLGSCDAYPDGWSRSSCYGGVFMENVFTASPEKRDLSATDYHYPCSKLADQYKADCYMMQTTRMSEMGLNTDRLFEECKKAANYRLLCMQSIGRDLSNDARIGAPKPVAEKCEKVSSEDRQACTRGVVYALEDNTWDGKYGFPFCAAFTSAEDQKYCFMIAKAYLQNTFETTQAQIQTQCTQFAPANNICKGN